MAGWTAGWSAVETGPWSSSQEVVSEVAATAESSRAVAAPGGSAGSAALPWTPWWEQREGPAKATGAPAPSVMTNSTRPMPWWELQEQESCHGKGRNKLQQRQHEQEEEQLLLLKLEEHQQQQQADQQQAWWQSTQQAHGSSVWETASARRPPPEFEEGGLSAPLQQQSPAEHALLSTDGSAGYGGSEFAVSILDRRSAPKKKRMMWNYLWGELPPRLMASIQMDEVASFSVTDMRTADSISRELLTLPGVSEASTVTDATACVGGNAISLARFFRVVNAVELDPVRLQMLQHNLAVCLEGQRLASCPDCGRLQGLCLCPSPAGVAAADDADDAADADDDAAEAQALAALRGPPEPGVTGAAFESTGVTMPLRPITGQLRLLLGDCLRVCAGMPQDIVFLDPPWGGKGYKQREKIELFLSHKPIHEVCAELGKHARYVALKLPLRADSSGLRAITGATVVKEMRVGAKMLLIVLEFSRDLSGDQMAFLMNIGLKGIKLE
jgi:hypothetical protein